ncbi:MAG: ABC transporter substrate-binding protein [Actinomycetota bacterium]
MQYRILPTIGALVILVGIGVAVIVQIGSNRDTAAADIEVPVTTSTTSTTVEDSDSTTSTTTPDPFTYRIGILSGISTDNFWAFYGREPSVWNSYVLGPTKPALYTTNPARGAIEPELAADEAEPVRDGDSWRVEVALTPDLAWSDGTAITADDLVFTFETVRALDLGGSWQEAFPESVVSIEAEDDHSVVIEFSDRPRLSTWPHGVGMAPIMARHLWQPKIDGISAEELYELSGESDVSGGPMVLNSVADDRIVSRANEGYHRAGGPDIVEYQIFEDEESAVDALADGEIDYILTPKGLTAKNAASLEANPDVELAESPGHAIRYVGFNLDREPMSDRAFRAALALLIDRSEMSVATGAGPAAWSMVPEANRAWYDPDAVSAIAEPYGEPAAARLAVAIETLEDAGYEWQRPPSIQDGDLIPGEGLTVDGTQPGPLTILTPGDAYDPERPEYAAAVAEALSVLGFDARPVETDFDTVVDLAFTPEEDGERKYDMYLLGWTLGNPGLPAYYGSLFSSEGPLNNTGYASEEFDEALARYGKAVDVGEAFDALWAMERVLAKDLPYLPLYTNTITEAYRSDRVAFPDADVLGGIQARLGGIRHVSPADS